MSIKKILLTTGIVIMTVFTSCKFDQTLIGTYTGTYSSDYTVDSLPVPNGNGTITIIEAGPDRVNVLFTSAGNPDIQRNDLIVKHSSLQSNYFTICSQGNYVIGNYHPGQELNFSVSGTNGIIPWIFFTGTKQ